jgi:hypothetical protein
MFCRLKKSRRLRSKILAMPKGRNDALSFANYAWTNFEFIEQAAKGDAHDLHPVTQLVLSLLGLIVCQRENNKREFNREVKATKPESLLDWQLWNASEQCYTLKDLIDNLRHSVAHGHVTFDSESHNQDEVYISFCNKLRKGGPWTARIRADHLRTFCFKFKALLEQSNSN